MTRYHAQHLLLETARRAVYELERLQADRREPYANNSTDERLGVVSDRLREAVTQTDVADDGMAATTPSEAS